MNISKLFSLGWNDAVKGLVVAILSGVLTFIYETLTTGTVIDWQQVSVIAITAGISYLIKNFFTTQDGKFLGAI